MASDANGTRRRSAAQPRRVNCTSSLHHEYEGNTSPIDRDSEDQRVAFRGPLHNLYDSEKSSSSSSSSSSGSCSGSCSGSKGRLDKETAAIQGRKIMKAARSNHLLNDAANRMEQERQKRVLHEQDHRTQKRRETRKPRPRGRQGPSSGFGNVSLDSPSPPGTATRTSLSNFTDMFRQILPQNRKVSGRKKAASERGPRTFSLSASDQLAADSSLASSVKIRADRRPGTRAMKASLRKSASERGSRTMGLSPADRSGTYAAVRHNNNNKSKTSPSLKRKSALERAARIMDQEHSSRSDMSSSRPRPSGVHSAHTRSFDMDLMTVVEENIQRAGTRRANSGSTTRHSVSSPVGTGAAKLGVMGKNANRSQKSSKKSPNFSHSQRKTKQAELVHELSAKEVIRMRDTSSAKATSMKVRIQQRRSKSSPKCFSERLQGPTLSTEQTLPKARSSLRPTKAGVSHSSSLVKSTLKRIEDEHLSGPKSSNRDERKTMKSRRQSSSVPPSRRNHELGITNQSTRKKNDKEKRAQIVAGEHDRRMTNRRSSSTGSLGAGMKDRSSKQQSKSHFQTICASTANTILSSTPKSSSRPRQKSTSLISMSPSLQAIESHKKALDATCLARKSSSRRSSDIPRPNRKVVKSGPSETTPVSGCESARKEKKTPRRKSLPSLRRESSQSTEESSKKVMAESTSLKSKNSQKESRPRKTNSKAKASDRVFPQEKDKVVSTPDDSRNPSKTINNFKKRSPVSESSIPPLDDVLSVDLSVDSFAVEGNSLTSSSCDLSVQSTSLPASATARKKRLPGVANNTALKSGSQTNPGKVKDPTAKHHESHLGSSGTKKLESMESSETLNIFIDNPIASPDSKSLPSVLDVDKAVALVERLASSMPQLSHHVANKGIDASSGKIKRVDIFTDDSDESMASDNASGLGSIQDTKRLNVMADIANEMKDSRDKKCSALFAESKNITHPPTRSPFLLQHPPSSPVPAKGSRRDSRSPRKSDPNVEQSKLDRGPRKPFRRSDSFDDSKGESVRSSDDEGDDRQAMLDLLLSSKPDEAADICTVEEEEASPVFPRAKMQFRRNNEGWMQAPPDDDDLEVEASIQELQSHTVIYAGGMRRCNSTGDVEMLSSRWSNSLSPLNDNPPILRRRPCSSDLDGMSDIPTSDYPDRTYALLKGEETKVTENRSYLPISLQSAATSRHERTRTNRPRPRRADSVPGPSENYKDCRAALMSTSTTIGRHMSANPNKYPDLAAVETGLAEMFEIIGKLEEDLNRSDHQTTRLRRQSEAGARHRLLVLAIDDDDDEGDEIDMTS